MQQFEIVGMQLSGANITIEHKTIGGTLQVDNKELERARREGPGLKLSPHYVNELPVFTRAMELLSRRRNTIGSAQQ